MNIAYSWQTHIFVDIDIRAIVNQLLCHFAMAAISSDIQWGLSALCAQIRILRDTAKACKYILLRNATRMLRVRLIRETDSTQACEYAFLPHIYHAHLAFVVDIQTSFNQLFRHFDMAVPGSGKQYGPSVLRAHNHTATSGCEDV